MDRAEKAHKRDLLSKKVAAKKGAEGIGGLDKTGGDV